MPGGVDFRVERSKISVKTGKCDVCGEKLKPVFVHPREYERLLEEGIVKRLIWGTDVFRNTNPEEVNKFMK